MKLVVVIIILLAVLSTPLSLKKLIDRSNSGKGGLPGKDDVMSRMEPPIQKEDEGEPLDEKHQENQE